MNKNKIQYKYLMNLWRTFPDYPTQQDVIYELSVYLLKDGRPNGEFSHQTFNSAFGGDWEKTKHKPVIESLIGQGKFQETEKSSGSKKWYKIKDNPYYS